LGFAEGFSGPSAFRDRFAIFAGNFIDPQLRRTPDAPDWADPITQVQADHDVATCGDPNVSKRLLNAKGRADAGDASKFFYQCAPGGDSAKAHVMTSFDTTMYAIMAFSPNRSFTDVSRICWDINATDEGGGKWTNVDVIPESLYRRFPSSDVDGKGTDGFRLDYVSEGFNTDGATGDFNIQAGDHPGTEVWGIKDFRGTQTQFVGDDVVFKDNTVVTTADHSARFQHCVVNKPGGGAVLTVQRPGGRTDTFDLPRAIPQGVVRVVFQDDMYDAPKRDGYSPSSVSWHWDNIQIG